MDGLDANGYKQPTPIQDQVIPHIIERRDVIACAQTGTGKTAAFLLPLTDYLINNAYKKDISAVIIVPTRELALQISQQMEAFSYYTQISSIAVFGGNGGEAFVEEKRALQNGVDVVICTPGKMIAHLNMGYVNFKRIQTLVLDEADNMLDMGFHADIMKIISYMPKERQTLLFSATMPPKIKQLAQSILVNPIEISVAVSKPNENIQQGVFLVNNGQKMELVKNILSQKSFDCVLIFGSKKQSVKDLAFKLKRAKFEVAEIHSDLEQREREDVINKFKGGKIKILVATDILSRGIDVDGIDLVINFDLPKEGEDYIHRIGRTARGENAHGTAYTFVEEREQYNFLKIQELVGKEIPKLPIPEVLGAAPQWKSKEELSSKSARSSNHNKGGKPRWKPKPKQ
jgi:ATP-dependent RNA helicase RhlE